jgi:uncharacterized protein YjiK
MARDLKIIVISMTRFIIISICLIMSLAFLGCNDDKAKYSSPSGYNLTKPYQFKLPLELDEISGVSFYPKDSSIFAINDEKGWLYKIKVGPGKKIDRWNFAPGADFEDVVMVDSTFYVLQSHGSIIRVNFLPGGKVAPPKKYPFPFGVENEFEILYYDDIKKKLILICKDCDSDKKSFLTTYAFDPVTEQFSDPPFTIRVDSIAASLGIKKFRFKPSAASINPQDSLLYIISAVNKMLVITDRDGKFKKAHHISHHWFKQPEGITFTPWGTMIISNEAADIGVADILIFKRDKK